MSTRSHVAADAFVRRSPGFLVTTFPAFEHVVCGRDARGDRNVRLLRHVRPYTTGEELRALGVPPGPAYRAVLESLRAAWLDGKITSKSEEQVMLRQLLAQYPDAPAGDG